MASGKRREAIQGKRGIYFRLAAPQGKNGQRRKIFEITYRDSDGKQRWKVVEGGIRAAETELAAVKARMGRGERVAPTPNLTFGIAAKRWQEAQASSLRHATRSAYGSSLRIHLLPVWKNRKLDTIHVDDVARLIESMQARGYKAWTIRGVLTVSGRVFDFAGRRLGWAGQNPVRQLDRSERPRSDQKERRVLTRKELAELIEAANDPYRPIFQLAAGTGARLGECIGLKWRSIDFDRGTVAITHQLDRQGNYVELKTKRSRRSVELPAPLLASLRQMKLASPNSGPNDFVFQTKAGTPHDHRNIGGRALARAIRTAGIDTEAQPAPTFHSFRHGFASAWIDSGGNLVELSAHLGHRDPSITASVYAHEFEKAAGSDERRSRIESMFGSALETNLETDGGSSGRQTATADPKKPAPLRVIAGDGSSPK